MKKIKLEEKLEKKLSAGKFRLMNEMLYKNKKIDLTDYFNIYNEQSKRWTYHPLEKIVPMINEDAFIVDIGCGDALISQKFNKVINIDLYSNKKGIIRSNSECIPIKKEVFDVAVFSLSLMNINCTKSIYEAYRILKMDGYLIIAEIISRINNTDDFVKDIESVGFIKEESFSDKWYFISKFRKTTNEGKEKKEIILKPCLYKKR